MVKLKEPSFKIELSNATSRTSSTAKDLVLRAINAAVDLDYRRDVWQMTELSVREETWFAVWQATEMAIAHAVGECECCLPIVEEGMTLSVFKNEVVEYVVAESEADASRVWRETVGEDYNEELCGAWERQSDDTALSIADDSGENKESKTCAEWVACNGRGFLCSTEY